VLPETGASLRFRTTAEVHDGRVSDDPTGELVIDFPSGSGALVDVIAVEPGEPGANTNSRPS
jgi:hypothetical protein